MKLKVFSTIYFFIGLYSINAQNVFSGKIYSAKDTIPLADVQLYDYNSGFIMNSYQNGEFNIVDEYNTTKKLVFHKQNYNYLIVNLTKKDSIYNIFLDPLTIQLDEIMVSEKRNNFNSGKLNDVVANAIFAGKKTDKIIIQNKMANTASNNARQIYNKIGGLNIFQNDDAGLQLNIGGRGLNPSRSANFNTRQNGYDISADVLGYPESYYTPPAEALTEIQITRGASSLQYGTQFGGLINFVLNKPTAKEELKIKTRNTIGSNALYTNFSSAIGTHKKIGYYTFVNYKSGDGFRPNSQFKSTNIYTYLDYTINPQVKISFEITHLNYLTQQAGGLTDQMFNQNPLQSNRERNWFKVNWLLYNSKIYYELDKNNQLNISLFGLNAYRYALGFRDNRVDMVDPLNERDLIKGKFKNYGIEKRFLHKYLFLKKSILLVGYKLYKSNNSSEQGPGSADIGPDFNFYTEDYPYYINQSSYTYPNFNFALFGENIFYINNNLSIIPGARYEYIKTESVGSYRNIRFNLADMPVFDTTYYEDRSNIRSFILLGTGISYKIQPHEFYANISQNYRSVTFSDISIKNPSFLIDPNIQDESGYTYDIGIRGKYSKYIRYDVNYFGLIYNKRIGFISKVIEESPGYFTVKTQRSNVGNARIDGIESLLDYNLSNYMPTQYQLNGYINFAYTSSLYVKSETNGIEGNEVEFTPHYNVRTGLNLGFKNHMGGIQFSYLSDQYTDASNSEDSDITGIIGKIPAYYILDISYRIKSASSTLFFGINNITNNSYFTRRASGYPGPGIIPSSSRNYYLTLEFQL